jgi:hypothetical protein
MLAEQPSAARGNEAAEMLANAREQLAKLDAEQTAAAGEARSRGPGLA